MHHGVATGLYVADTYSMKLRQIFIYNLCYKINFIKQNFMLKIKNKKCIFGPQKKYRQNIEKTSRGES